MRAFLIAAAASLALAAPAAAGGWATAGLGPPDGGVGAGDTWNAKMTILQHGQTPLVGVAPSVVISKGDDTYSYPAEPTAEPGVYVAKVKFPSAGEWRYLVNDGFGQTHTFAPVQIAAGAGDSGFAVPEWTFGVLAAAIGLLAIFLLARRSRPASAPAVQP